jgi:hypothetical protein
VAKLILMKSVFLYFLLFLLGNLSVQAQTSSDTTIISNHLTKITKEFGYRTYWNIAVLNKTADYIFDQFNKFGDTTYFQNYTIGGKTYRNVICSFGPKDAEAIIVGAHYDVYGEQEGADDNASGIVGLLELARLLRSSPIEKRIDLVAYTLEEPPYFRTEMMGSYQHAKSLSESHVKVTGMICLEMIGYFDDAKGSQHYPLKVLSLFNRKKGDYITLVNKVKKGHFSRDFSRNFRKSHTIRIKKVSGPKSLQGIDFSDHMNYWNFGISALMITDTGFYRNGNYHIETDTMETLDLQRMAAVIDGVFLALVDMGK